MIQGNPQRESNQRLKTSDGAACVRRVWIVMPNTSGAVHGMLAVVSRRRPRCSSHSVLIAGMLSQAVSGGVESVARKLPLLAGKRPLPYGVLLQTT